MARRKETPPNLSSGLAPLALFAVSGACGIVYEVLWFRMLELQFGSMTTTAALILATFLLGLALGSSTASRVLRTKQLEPGTLLRWYASAEAVIGAYGALT